MLTEKTKQAPLAEWSNAIDLRSIVLLDAQVRTLHGAFTVLSMTKTVHFYFLRCSSGQDGAPLWVFSPGSIPGLGASLSQTLNDIIMNP